MSDNDVSEKFYIRFYIGLIEAAVFNVLYISTAHVRGFFSHLSFKSAQKNRIRILWDERKDMLRLNAMLRAANSASKTL